MDKPKKVKVMYVNNREFYNDIVAYRKKLKDARESGKEDPRIPDSIGLAIWKIAEKLSTKPCFINYSFRDEMVADGVENCILYFKDYDPDWGQAANPDYVPNPFAYFTQVIYYAFLRRINKEEKNRYTIYKNFQEVMCNNHDLGLLRDSEDNHLMPSQIYDNINIFMKKFEEKEERKKQKRKKAKEGLTKYFEE
jgi:hypothetical protein